MLDKLNKLKERYAFLTEEIGKSEVISKRDEWQKLVKEHAEIEPIVLKFDEYEANASQIAELKKMLKE